MDTPKILPTNGSASGSWESAADKAKAGARETIDKVTGSAQQAMDRISDKTSQAVSALSEKAGQLKETQDQLMARARIRIREKPVQSLAIALAAGFLLRHLLKSR